MANRNLSCTMLYGGLSVNLNHLKMEFWRIYFYTFILVFGLKYQNTNGRKSLLNFFDICKIST